MSRDEVVLLDIANACENIAEFIREMDSAEFFDDIKTQSAVMHQILVIGEAVKRLSPEFRQFHAEIPWKDMAGMRDRLIHDYDNVDLDRVWDTVTESLPALLKQIRPFIPPPP
ncbi:MAG: DUF86 domain-containing protein [Anaerolineae bacterium]|jgi:uncharacterized protein with HEPN domain|nr:DUF86 domain-containing protein [Anaerolineae bacterium]